MPIVLCDRCGHYGDTGKSPYCTLCGKQLSKTEYSSEDADNGLFNVPQKSEELSEEGLDEHRV